MEKGYREIQIQLFEKITALIEEINQTLMYSGMKFQSNPEYVSAEIREMAACYADFYNLDPPATFMRIKTDYTSNDQQLPAYNVRIGIADEYIAVLDVNQYRGDMDCFIPLMQEFKRAYGF